MENVKNLISRKHKDNFIKWKEWLSECGYNTYVEVLNAREYGVPQKRERLFAVSIKKDQHLKFSFPPKSPLCSQLKNWIDDVVDESYYHITPSVQRNISNLYDKIISCSKDIWVPTQSEVSVGRQDHLVGINATPCLRVNGYSLVLDKTNRIRRLTEEEYWRLMGVSYEYYQKVLETGITKTNLYKLAGNSIVVPVLEAIFQQLLREYIIANQNEVVGF